jgi:nitrogen fixation protein NifX
MAMALKTRMKVLDGNTDESWIDAALKVAFASTDMKSVNQHFGSAEALAIYAVDMERTELLEVFQFGALAQDGNEDKLSCKIDALDDCIAVYSQAVGASAIGQLKAKGVHPVKVSAGAGINDLLESLQDELRMGPGVWLAKAIKSQTPVDPSRFDEMEAEGWEE